MPSGPEILEGAAEKFSNDSNLNYHAKEPPDHNLRTMIYGP